MTRVVLTQPLPRVERLAQRLAGHGHEVVALPVRQLRSLAREPQACAAIASIGERDWVVFVSPGAVEIAAQALSGRWPPATGVALIGPGSEQALADHGIRIDPARISRPAKPPYDADALLRTPPFDAPAGLCVLVLAGTHGRTDWIATLRERGATVERVEIYRTEAVAPDPQAIARLRLWSREPSAVVFVFTSADAVPDVEDALARVRLRSWARRQRALAPHPRIAALLAQRGWRSAAPIEPGERALRAAIESA